MARGGITREAIVGAIARALKPLNCVHAAWEGGAASRGAIDRWSDVDVNVDADDGTAGAVFAAVERALEKLSGIDSAYRIPFPPSHDYAQRFYRVNGASRFALVDLAVFRHSAQDKFLNPALHGMPVFIMVRGGYPCAPRWSRRAFVKAMRARFERLKARHAMFACFVEKELERGNSIEALSHYQRLLLDTLLEVLRMRYGPAHHAFGVRYVHQELPPAVVRRFERLAFVRDEADLRRKAKAATRWLEDAMDGLDFGDVERRLGA
jgi:predicted nucleotidyltransferase